MTVLIFVLIVVFAIKYRRRTRDEVPPATKSAIWMEITWTIVPFFIFIGMFWWGASLYVDMRRPMKRRAGDQRDRQAVDVEIAASGRAARDR